LDTDVLITTTAGGPGSATVAATMAIDEQQINALLLDVVCSTLTLKNVVG
jgi:aarF domain-containing kinase